MSDRRRPCNCGPRTQVLGESIVAGEQIGRTVMGNDFRFIDGDLIIHRGYDGKSRSSCYDNVPNETRKLLAEIERIEQIQSEGCNSGIRRRASGIKEIKADNSDFSISKSSYIIPKDNAIDSIIQNITIRGESSVIGMKPIWDANSWQNNNPTVPNGIWLPTTMPYIYNFGSLGQFGDSINVDVLYNDKNGTIVWGIVDKDGNRVKNKVVLNLDYKTDFYKVKNDFRSEAEIELIDIGNSLAGFYTKLKTNKNVYKNENKVNLEYTIEWYPTVQTKTDPSIDLSNTIKILSGRCDIKSRDKLNEILSIVSEAIDNTKLTIFIKYGSSLKKFNSIGSLLAIDIINN
jgi:hypothetical protein